MFVAALAFEGFESVAILDAITTVVKIIQTFSSIPEKQNELINDTLTQQTFTQIISYNNETIIQVDFDKLKQEKIISIQRYCESFWKYIPSGFASIFTWAFTGQATRHEFVIIETENHMGVMEMIKRKIKDKEIYFCDIQWWKCGNLTQKDNKKNEILQHRKLERCQCNVDVNSFLTVAQLQKFINVVLFCWSKLMRPHLILQKMILFKKYFCEPQPDYTWVLQSIFGCFTDKPMKLPRLDMIAIEKVMWHGQKLSNDKKQKLLDFEEILKNIRTVPNNV